VSEAEQTSGLDLIEAEMEKAGWKYESLGSDEGTVGSLLIETDESDCLVEIFPDGRFACQFGVDIEEMRSLLTGDQTEDMQDDELVRVVRYHLKPIVDRYRALLLKEGLEEGVDATPHYYAMHGCFMYALGNKMSRDTNANALSIVTSVGGRGWAAHPAQSQEQFPVGLRPSLLRGCGLTQLGLGR